MNRKTERVDMTLKMFEMFMFWRYEIPTDKLILTCEVSD